MCTSQLVNGGVNLYSDNKFIARRVERLKSLCETFHAKHKRYPKPVEFRYNKMLMEEYDLPQLCRRLGKSYDVILAELFNIPTIGDDVSKFINDKTCGGSLRITYFHAKDIPTSDHNTTIAVARYVNNFIKNDIPICGYTLTAYTGHKHVNGRTVKATKCDTPSHLEKSIGLNTG